MPTHATRPDYGVDAPGLCRAFLISGLVCLVLVVVACVVAARATPWALIGALILAIPAVYLTGLGAFIVYESKVTKVAARERQLDLMAWQGDEAVLDVGCGRGLMLVGAARRLTTGKAVGIDVWRAEDQSANTPDAPLQNARLEGVADRIEVRTADMRSLPFGDQAFDVVVTQWAVHNLDKTEERMLALAEMWRVLKPGGALLLSDIEHRDAYRAQLAGLGAIDERIIVSAAKDAILKAITFGTFQPATIFARKA